MMEMQEKKLFHLDVLIEKQEDVFTAHCLQFDILTEGNTIAEAEEMIVDAVFEYIAFALEQNLTQFLFKPAPPADWQKLLYSVSDRLLKLEEQDELPLIAQVSFHEVECDAKEIQAQISRS